MKKVLFAILFLAPSLALAAKPTPNPADYTITVHVQSSRLVPTNCGNGLCNLGQELTVLIDGKNYELKNDIVPSDLLRVGDYKARIARDEAKRAYEYSRAYEFLFADGQTRLYEVVGETE